MTTAPFTSAKIAPRLAPMICALLTISAGPACWGANWQSNVSKEPAGSFPPPRSYRATFGFGWAGITAATADTNLNFSPPRYEFKGAARTIGLARALWRYDTNYRSVGDARTLRPIEARQVETLRSKKVTTAVSYTAQGVISHVTEEPGKAKKRHFSFSAVNDLVSTMLYLRSQPMKDRSVYRVVVYPATSAYLATVTVTGREKIRVRAGTFDAIKCDLQLSKINKRHELEPHKKFRRGTVWISDDSDRILLRSEAQIFVGTVFGELQSIRFER